MTSALATIGDHQVASLQRIADALTGEVSALRFALTGADEHRVRIGRLLADAKQVVGHGQWEVWVREQTGWSTSTAWRYMLFAEKAEDPARVQDLPLREVRRGPPAPAGGPGRPGRADQQLRPLPAHDPRALTDAAGEQPQADHATSATAFEIPDWATGKLAQLHATAVTQLTDALTAFSEASASACEYATEPLRTAGVSAARAARTLGELAELTYRASS